MNHRHPRARLLAAALAAASLLLFSNVSFAKDRFFEVFLGVGGGYEYFKLQSAGASILSRNLGPECASAPTACITSEDVTGHGGLWRAFGGVKLAMMGLGIDYRQSYIQGPVSWGQLMGDFWIFLPVPIVKPFIKIGVGFIHLRVKDVSIPGTGSSRDGDLIKGLGLRGGAGLLVKPIKWISVGATCEVAGTYFRENNDTTWGYAVDVTVHFMVHI
jgi:hypothetical protein